MCPSSKTSYTLSHQLLASYYFRSSLFANDERDNCRTVEPLSLKVFTGNYVLILLLRNEKPVNRKTRQNVYM